MAPCPGLVEDMAKEISPSLYITRKPEDFGHFGVAPEVRAPPRPLPPIAPLVLREPPPCQPATAILRASKIARQAASQALPARCGAARVSCTRVCRASSPEVGAASDAQRSQQAGCHSGESLRGVVCYVNSRSDAQDSLRPALNLCGE